MEVAKYFLLGVLAFSVVAGYVWLFYRLRLDEKFFGERPDTVNGDNIFWMAFIPFLPPALFLSVVVGLVLVGKGVASLFE